MTIQLSRLFRFSPVNKTITTAAEQDKSLVFFVTDEGELSNKWENDYLKSHEILPLLEKSSIIVRLEEESPEAAVLCAFCPEEKAPYISIVKNDAVLANIPHTVGTQAQFTAAIHAAFPSVAPPQVPVNPNTPAALFAERKARVDAQQAARKAQEQKERIERQARDKVRREAETPARKKYIAEQKKLREDDIAEKRRILMLVENDKIERREKEMRKAHGQASTPARVKEEDKLEKRPMGSGETLMTFRLLNGTMLKNTFPNESKLADVRKWVDKNRDDSQVPYNFQQIAPLKLLSASDENLSLAELGYSHGTTLVLTNKTHVSGMPIDVGEWNPGWAE